MSLYYNNNNNNVCLFENDDEYLCEHCGYKFNLIKDFGCKNCPSWFFEEQLDIICNEKNRKINNSYKKDFFEWAKIWFKNKNLKISLKKTFQKKYNCYEVMITIKSKKRLKDDELFIKKKDEFFNFYKDFYNEGYYFSIRNIYESKGNNLDVYFN